MVMLALWHHFDCRPGRSDVSRGLIQALIQVSDDVHSIALEANLEIGVSQTVKI